MNEVVQRSGRELCELRRDDGSLTARGFMEDGEQTGYWEWYRRDGTLLRSGYFEAGRPIGSLTEHDEAGRVQRASAIAWG
ncbi:toxin-antitoxin system YwqK family antitoxin [Defluviimonas salinarum]|uniref:MORN repeat variant n=1 Tax=Defluviimonas salinarum TaxID=2992147 RepID=A0ABT3J376_9RHOB|nr:hypothetical protein [Defluviimonas salinarum]MCW3782130.1 hypothetical protein [Defluviimonas salinarum]